MHRNALALPVARFGDAPLTGVRRNAPERIHHRDLAAFCFLVREHENAQRAPGGGSAAHQLQPTRPVRHFGVCLRRDGSDAGFCPRHDRSDGKEMRLHRNAELTRLGIARNDRIGHPARICEAPGSEYV